MGGFNLYAYAPNPIDWIDPWGLAMKSCSRNNEKANERRLSDSNPVRREIREQYENIITGKGTPRVDQFNNQKIYQGRESPHWAGAKEWDVPGTNHRILERTLPDGRRIFGYAENHNYGHIKVFPKPWYPDGGKI